MYRPTTYAFIFILSLTILSTACGKSSNPMRSTQPAQRAERLPAGKALAVTSFADTLSETGIKAKSHGSNHPPVMNSPAEVRTLVILFPRGPASSLKFAGEPGMDPDGDDLSYRIGFAVPEIPGVSSPDKALLNVSRVGNRFDIRPDGLIAPAEFTAVYGNRATIPTVLAGIFASDGVAESKPEGFDLYMVYDGSAQFVAPAQYVGDQRWKIPDPVEVYEGTTLLESGRLPGWTAVIDARRKWGMDWRYPLVRCEISTDFFPYTFPDGGDDNGLFLLDPETQSSSGTVPLSFKSLPDYENPGDMNGDNEYQIRVVNTNNIHRLGGEGTPSGCSGSVLDFIVRVRDVGAPAPPTFVNAEFLDFDDSILEVNWTDPGGFIDNGSLVEFPAGFEVSDYDLRYRPIGTLAWTEISDDLQLETSITIEGFSEEEYEVQVRANNREGNGVWSSPVLVGRMSHTICFGAEHYRTIEGNMDGVDVEVHLDPPAGSIPVNVSIEVVEENGAGSEDYIGVPSSITFEPFEGVQTFSVVAVVDQDQDEGTEEFIRLMFVGLPPNVSTLLPASTEVVLKDEPSKPSIVSLRISSVPDHGRFYSFDKFIEVEAVFDEPVEVSGRPYLWLELACPGPRKVRYDHGSGTDTLYFRYRVVRHDWDTSGIGVASGNIVQNGGSITALSSGAEAILFHEGLPDDRNHKVNGYYGS